MPTVSRAAGADTPNGRRKAGRFLLQRRKKGQDKIKRAVYFIAIFLASFFIFSIVPAYLYYYSLISMSDLTFISTAAVSLSFSATTIAYLYLVEKSKKGMVQRLGLGRGALTVRNVLTGIFLFLIIFVLEIGVGLISDITGISINTNVALVFAGAPLWFILFASFIAPVNEEVLFRGLLVPRVGVFVSAVLFAAPHLSYDSTFAIEFLAALAFGLLAGYVFKRTGSLYPSIVAHVLVNALTLATTFSLLV